MKRVYLLAVLLIILISLCACFDESEELIKGEESLPDVYSEDLRDEDGRMEWPKSILPQDFPVAPDYTEIYSAERIDNNVRIVLIAKCDIKNGIDPLLDYASLLERSGYEQNIVSEEICWLNDAGVAVYLKDSITAQNAHLYSIAQESSTGYCYEISVDMIETEGLPELWTYDRWADLGLEPAYFEEWPEKHLPDNFPSPEKIDGIVLESLEQKSRGIFVVFTAYLDDMGAYGILMEKAGFRMAKYDEPDVKLYVNDNGDYCFVTQTQLDRDEENGPRYRYTFQICRYNDSVVR